MALVGGETAEMPGLYGEGDFEIVGVCVGACERSEVVSGERVQPGDAIIGLASSGLHTNGYTLARKVLDDAGISYSDRPEGLDRPVGEVYLEPHRAYVREVEALRETVEVRGMAHITGGGLVGNLPRALGGLGVRLDAGSWEEPAVFGLIRSLGEVPEEEMRKVFNLGVGFCAVVPPGEAETGLEALRGTGCEAWRIGEVTADRGGRVCLSGCPKARASRCSRRVRGRTCRPCSTLIPRTWWSLPGTRKGLSPSSGRGVSGVPVEHVDPAGFVGKDDYDGELAARISAHDVGLVVGAGYMRILSPVFLERFPAVLNVHPSLLPDFRGLRAVERALEAGVEETGVTVHFMVEEVDAGPIVAQERVPVWAGDTKETLLERLHPVEHRLLVGAVADYFLGRIEV